ncbi:hypothetical protein ACTWKC_20555 [Bacillus sp. 4A_MP3]
MKYILWFFILLLFSLFILGGYKAAVSHPDFPVPLFAMHTKTKEYEKGKYVSNYTYRFAKEEEGAERFIPIGNSRKRLET